MALAQQLQSSVNGGLSALSSSKIMSFKLTWSTKSSQVAFIVDSSDICEFTLKLSFIESVAVAQYVDWIVFELSDWSVVIHWG